MDRKLRNRILLYLLLAGVLAYGLLELSGRKPVPKISAVAPMRENLVSSINSNGKVEPVAPYVILARLDTFVKKVFVTEGQQVKKGQLLLELDVKDAAAQLAEAQVKRSEEHTSELQSPCNLVCRLLLEKKNNDGPVPRARRKFQAAPAPWQAEP